MLSRLYISNYALIEKLDIEFPSGFSVITGETGAGKSIILGALGLLLGQRADARAIKAGAKKCCIEGTFNIRGLNLEEMFSELDLSYEVDECIVRREVAASGKSRAFVNDSPVQLTALKALASKLIDIHSQHQNLLMGDENFLVSTLDSVADNQQILSDYSRLFDDWKLKTAQLEDLRENANKGKAEADYLSFQLQQLTEAKLESGEEEQLEAESSTLGHAEEIKAALFQSEQIFHNDDTNVISSLKTCEQTLQSIEGVYPNATPLRERIESSRIELEDVAEGLSQQTDTIEFDPERQAFVDSRLATIFELKKKHNVETVDQLIAKQEQLQQQLDAIENSDDEIKRLEREVSKARKDLDEAASKLTQSRRQAASKVEERLKPMLTNLGMPSAKLLFSFDTKAVPTTKGYDNISFLFSANKNVPPQNVASIASGGEIARLMLSLKTILSESRNLPTVIFDEIDTGVSGTMAESMGLVMRRMSQRCQVICITHLPQIAALGQTHFKVYKAESDSGTLSNIVQLTSEQRVTEIANMLSGSRITDAAIKNAKSLLNMD